MFRGQKCDEILIASGGLRFGEDLEVDFGMGCMTSVQCNVNFGMGCMTSVQCNVNFGYQLSICSRTEENHKKIWSICPVAEPSRCRPTDFGPAVQRSNTLTLMIVPTCAIALFTKNVHIFLTKRFLCFH